MIDKKVIYNDKDFSKHLKGLDLSEEDIKYILGETTRKKFEGGGDGGDGGDGGGGDGGGDGGDGGGDGGDGGDSSGDGEGSSNGSGGGVGGDDGAGASNAGDAGVGTGDSAGVGGSGDSTSGEGVGSGPGGEEGTGGVSAANAAAEGTGVTGVMSTLGNMARQAFNAYAAISPTAIAVNAISNAISNAQRGVTAPNDFSQATESVQSGPSTSPSGGDGGITNVIPERYQLYYETNPQNLDEFTRRIRLNLGLPI